MAANNEITIIKARIAGRKTPEGQVGGIYTPGDGQNRQARWESILMVNEYGPKKTDGTRETYTQNYMVTVWNSANATPGKGLADIFARNGSVGKELTYAVMARRQFPVNTVVNGQTIIDQSTGQPHTTTGESWIIRDFEFGPDSAKLIAAEIAAYNGQVAWGVRPPCFDGRIRADKNGMLPVIQGTGQVNIDQITAQQQTWQDLLTKRNAVVYSPGMKYFGYAAVKEAAATTPVNNEMAGQMNQPANIGTATTTTSTGSTIDPTIMQGFIATANGDPNKLAQIISAYTGNGQMTSGTTGQMDQTANADTPAAATTNQQQFAI